MKKYLIIAITCCFFIVGCSKVELTPLPQTNPVSADNQDPKSNANRQADPGIRITPVDDVNYCYVITNIETDWGVKEYLLTYTDCNGEFRKIFLPPGESITLCISDGVVNTNFAYTIEPFLGVC